jgi:hypothetical protein
MDFYARGIQGFEQGRARTARNRLAELSSAALSAPVEQRGQFAPQIAAIDPDAGFSFDQGIQRQQQAMQAESERRLGNMAKLLSVAPAEARGNLWSRIRPGLQQMGYEAPEAWDDSMLPVVQQLGGADQQGGRSAQREYVEWMSSQLPEDRRGEFMLTQAGLMPKVVNQQYSIEDVEMADGTVRRIQVPTRGGRVYGGEAGMAPPAPTPRRDIQITPTGEAPMPTGSALEQIMAGMASGQPFSVAVPPTGAPTLTRPTASDPSAAEMDRRANATLDAQTYSGGQATNATRAAAAAEAAAAKVRAEEIARREAQQINDAPGAVRDAEMMIGNIDAILKHPDLETVTGFSGLADPRNWPGINRGFGTSDVMARIEQLQGASFLEAFEKLKGGGAITEAEGKKAEQAQARLTTAQTDEAFKTALEDLRAAIEPALERARQRAAGGQGGQPPSAAPQGIPPGARQAADGNWYIEQGGRFFRVEV